MSENITVIAVPRALYKNQGPSASASIIIGNSVSDIAAIPPPNIQGLQIDNQGEGNLWVTQDLPLVCMAISTKPIDPTKPAGAYESDANFLDYVWAIYNSDGVTLRRNPEKTSDNTYNYTYAKNIYDGGSNGAATDVIVQCWAQDSSGALSAAPAILQVSSSGTNPSTSQVHVPGAPQDVTITGTKLRIYIVWSFNPDPSVMNYFVEVSTDGGVTWPITDTTPSCEYDFAGTVGTTYQARITAISYTGVPSAHSVIVSGTLAGINGGTDIAYGTVTADRLVTGQLIVGTNVTMGAGSTIAWGQVTSQPSIPNGTYINGSGVYTGTVNCTQLNAGTITASVFIDVTASSLAAILYGCNTGVGNAIYGTAYSSGSACVVGSSTNAGVFGGYFYSPAGVALYAAQVCQADGGFNVGSNAVVGARRTGWGTPTGTLYRTSLTNSSTQTQFNDATMAIITDLIAHGLIGA